MPALAPNLVAAYRRLVESLQPALSEGNPQDKRKIAMLRNPIRIILVSESGSERPETGVDPTARLRLILKGNLAVLLESQMEADGTTSLVAGGGLEPPT
jgi:hypothetical protein